DCLHRWRLLNHEGLGSGITRRSPYIGAYRHYPRHELSLTFKVAHRPETPQFALPVGTLYNQSFVLPQIALCCGGLLPALRIQEQCQNVRFSPIIGSAPRLMASASA